MRPILGAAAILAVGLLAVGCSAENKAPPAPALRADPAAFDAGRALEGARSFVALGPKVAGTPAGLAAAEYIRGRLAGMGLDAKLDEFEETSPAGATRFRNVEGVLRGRGGDWIVLGCHYDTKDGISPEFAGANDSGSGVGVLLELARTICAGGGAGRCSLLFAFFDGEECKRAYGPQDGFHGSRRLARRLAGEGLAGNVRGVVVVDMVGDADLRVTLPRNGDRSLMAAVFSAAAAEGVRDRFSLSRMDMLDDHQAFLNAGMPAVVLIDFSYGSAPGLNDYWHTTADTMDKLSAQSLGMAGRVVCRMLTRLDSTGAAENADSRTIPPAAHAEKQR